MAFFLYIAVALLLGAPLDAAGRDVRTKEQRLYDIKLREAQWNVDAAKLEMEDKLSTADEMADLYRQRIKTLDDLNRAKRDYQLARLAFDQAEIALEEKRLSFLRDATHISVLQARKYRTPDGRRQVEIVVRNASNLDQAVSLNPHKDPEEVASLLEIQNIRVSIQTSEGLIIGDPYEIAVPSLKLYQEQSLIFRLLDDEDSVVVKMRMADSGQDVHIILRKESLQDIPTINSVQFSQEGDLNSRVRYDIILERLAEDEKNFRLAIVNLPQEIDSAFRDPGTDASLTQVKFSEEITRQQLELEL